MFSHLLSSRLVPWPNIWCVLPWRVFQVRLEQTICALDYRLCLIIMHSHICLHIHFIKLSACLYNDWLQDGQFIGLFKSFTVLLICLSICLSTIKIGMVIYPWFITNLVLPSASTSLPLRTLDMASHWTQYVNCYIILKNQIIPWYWCSHFCSFCYFFFLILSSYFVFSLKRSSI